MSIFGVTSDADVEDDRDRVETDVVVNCDIEAAWALVSEPGWWVNEGPLGDHEVSLGDDGLYRVSDPDAGDWLIEKAEEDPMDVVAFRWYPLADDEAVASQAYDDAIGMWDQVLVAAKNYLEGR